MCGPGFAPCRFANAFCRRNAIELRAHATGSPARACRASGSRSRAPTARRVFCGQHRREHSKPVSVASVLVLLDEQDPALHGELFARTLRNMCAGALVSHAQWQPQEREAMFGACLCCHHWVARRKKGRLLFPLQALSWYVNTMLPVGTKNMDHRVVMRLSTTLGERGPLPANAWAADAQDGHIQHAAGVYIYIYSDKAPRS